MSALAPRRPLPRRGSLDAHGLGFALATARGPTLLVIAYVLFTPNYTLLPAAWGLTYYNEQRLLQVLLLALVGGWLILSTASRVRLVETFRCFPAPFRLALFTLVCLGLLSALMAPRPIYALLELATFLMLGVMATWVCTTRREACSSGDIALFSIIGITAFLYIVKFTAGWLGGMATGGNLSMRDYFPGFSNIRMFNQFHTLTLPLATGLLVLLWRRPHWRIPVFVLATVWWCLLFASAGRGALLATLGALLFTVLALRQRAKAWALAHAATGLAGFALYYLLAFLQGRNDLGARVGHLLESDSRLELWSQAISMMAANPILGGGPMHFAYESYPLGSPHSSLVQIGSEWGLPALAIVIVVAGYGCWAWFRQSSQPPAAYNSHEAAVRSALSASLCAGLAESLVSGTIVSPVSQVTLALVIGWAAGIYWEGATPYSVLRHRGRRLPNRFAVALLSAAILTLGIGAATSLAESKERERHLRVEGELLGPRFWLPGNIGPHPSTWAQYQ